MSIGVAVYPEHSTGCNDEERFPAMVEKLNVLNEKSCCTRWYMSNGTSACLFLMGPFACLLHRVNLCGDRRELSNRGQPADTVTDVLVRMSSSSHAFRNAGSYDSLEIIPTIIFSRGQTFRRMRKAALTTLKFGVAKLLIAS